MQFVLHALHNITAVATTDDASYVRWRSFTYQFHADAMI